MVHLAYMYVLPMNYADMLEKWFADGQGDLWRNVRAMPEDKLDWKPAETSRSARELVEEIVSVMPYNITLIKTFKEPSDGWEGDGAKKSIDELEKEFSTAVAEFIEAVRAFPDEKLDEKIDLPWGNMSFAQVISYPYWNLMYHIGQIAYIQTMYGDKDMH